MTSPDYSAEIERMLGGAGGDPTPGAPPSDDPVTSTIVNPALNEHGQQAPGGLPREDPAVVALRDQLHAANARAAELGAQLASRPPLPTAEGTAPPAQVPADVERLKKQLEDSFLKDPGGTLLSMAAYMQTENQKMTEAAIAKATGGIKSDVTGGNVAAFRAKMQSDPILAPAVDEFDKLIKEIGPNLTPGNMSQQLDALASTALGNTFRSRLPGARQQAPPAWGGGMTATPDSGMQSTGPGPSKMTTEQQEYVKTMIDLGLSKEVINERLKNWDHEGGFTKQ
jgi:hypothetical protein